MERFPIFLWLCPLRLQKWGRRRLGVYDEALLSDRFAVDTSIEDADDSLFLDRDNLKDEGALQSRAYQQLGRAFHCWPVNAVWALTFYTFLLAAYFVVLFIPWRILYTEHLPVKISLHVMFLPLAATLQRLLLLQHERHSCMDYLQFYNRVRDLVMWPLLATSVANAAILLCTQWPHGGYLDTRQARTHMLQAIAGAELISLVFFCSLYTRGVSQDLQPQILPTLQSCNWHASSPPPPPPPFRQHCMTS
mmetsp:Transcript_16530/g.46136  ORF Transcript_16530/g.46136 Transcript_16530/m.46136 type:complete len:249 (-) Transcript_16530:336-1082(-)